MTLHAFNYNLTFELITPGCCDVPFMVTSDLYNKRRRDHKYWWCPNCGSSRYFNGETEEQKLKDQLRLEKQRKEAALHRANEEKLRADKLAQKEKVQRNARIRLKKRIINGVCPCCNRHFPNLFKHIKTKHQHYIQQLSLVDILTEMGITQSDLAAALDIRSSYISNYKNDKYLPAYAKEKIEDWLNEQALNEVGSE